jgi:D-alanyl-lipoteichoic acid acyltransferase DltB (MBOAT superfamily)
VIFPSLEFAALFAVVLPISWLLMPYRRPWKLFIIGASYLFYGYADWHFVFLLAGCTLWSQLCARVIAALQRERLRSWALGIALAGDLGMLGWFKYYGFFVNNVAVLTGRLGLPLPLPLLQVALPIGISFFTFQAMSYVIDVRRRVMEPASLLDFALFQSFFPHLIAGPIVRPRELIPQFGVARNPNDIEFVRALTLITGGLIKKVIIADLLATQIVDPTFGTPVLHSRWDVIAAIYGYAVQIYCDFSAYSDIAIGLALLLGYQFPPNFDRPYASITLQDFWRRWHITLSRWLRDYVYIGFGGNRKGRLKTYRNLFLTFLLGGLWHGAAWNFVLWGALHGIGLAAERWWLDVKQDRRVALPALRWFITVNFVCFAWVFFRADNLSTVSALGGQLLSSGGATTVTPGVILAILTGFAIQFVPREPALYARDLFARAGPVLQGAVFGLVLFGTGVIISGQGVAPFIYYRF